MYNDRSCELCFTRWGDLSQASGEALSAGDELLVAQDLATTVQGADQRTRKDRQQGEGKAEAEQHGDHAG